MSAVKIKKICCKDLEKYYTSKKTKTTYKGLFINFVNALERCTTLNEDGKTWVVFKSVEEYEDFIKDCQRAYTKQSMQQMFYGMFGGLAKRFHFPRVYGLNVGFRPKQHKGFTQTERQKILNYCLSEQDDNKRLMLVSKFITLLLLETGLRGGEVYEFMKRFVESKFIAQCLDAENDETILTSLDNSSQTLPIVGKWNIPRQISITPNVIKLWRKLINQRGTCYKHTLKRDQVNYLFHKVMKALNIPGTPHDCRVSFATWLYELGVPLKQIQQAMGHTNIEQTLRYIRCYDTARAVTRAMMGKKVDKASDTIEEEIKALKSELTAMRNMLITLLEKQA